MIKEAPVPTQLALLGAIAAVLLVFATTTTVLAADDAAGVMPCTLPALRPELEPAADRLYKAHHF